MRQKFHKLEAAGNDFIVLERGKLSLPSLSALAKKLCDRHKGVGADGLIAFEKGRVARRRMRVFNADSSDGQTSGNGARCLAHLLVRLKKERGSRVVFETGRGALEVIRLRNNVYRVNMGEPEWEAAKIPLNSTENAFINRPIETGGRRFLGSALSVGNPHLVLFVDSLPSDWKELGQKLERHPLFPKGVNVEFVKVISKKSVQLAVWERGVGETLACGSGSAAVAAAGVITGRLARKVNVKMPGGVLQAEWNLNGSLYISGPVNYVFSGEMEL
jgi:diaminopimelate epimerase